MIVSTECLVCYYFLALYPQSHALCLYINGAHAHVCYRTKTDLQVYSSWATLKMFSSGFIRIQLSGIQ